MEQILGSFCGVTTAARVPNQLQQAWNYDFVIKKQQYSSISLHRPLQVTIVFSIFSYKSVGIIQQTALLVIIILEKLVEVQLVMSLYSMIHISHKCGLIRVLSFLLFFFSNDKRFKADSK